MQGTRLAASCQVLSEALSYAGLGWRVLPLRPREKKPLVAGGVHAATDDPGQLERWWQRWPDAGIAVACGEASGVVVIDTDPRTKGDKTMVSLTKRLGKLPLTATAISGRGDGGGHLYFQHPGGKLLHDLGPGVHVQGAGQYVVAPPSLHELGGAYRWDLDPLTVPPATLPPDWLAAITRGRTQEDAEPKTQSVSQKAQRWGNSPLEGVQGWLEGYIRETAPVVPGTRHGQLLRFLRRLKRHPELADKPAAAIRPLVRAWHQRAVCNASWEECWSDAARAWEVVVAGREKWRQLVADAALAESPAFVRELEYTSTPALMLVNLVRELGLHAGGGSFPLSVRKAAEAAGCRLDKVISLLKMLEADGVIEKVRPADKLRLRATEWRYTGGER